MTAAPTLPAVLMAASAFIVGALGLAHLVFTFFGPRLRPRDPALVEAMDRVHPGITRQTTIWKMWIGFNASHSLGAILFGLVYGYLALARGDVLFGSTFLLATGLATLSAFALLARRYWFTTPFLGVSLSLLLYLAAAALSRSG